MESLLLLLCVGVCQEVLAALVAADPPNLKVGASKSTIVKAGQPLNSEAAVLDKGSCAGARLTYTLSLTN